MSKKWFQFWKKDEPAPAPTKDVEMERAEHPALFIQVLPDGSASAHVFLPELANNEERVQLAKAFAALVFLLSHGDLTPIIQSAIAKAGVSYNEEGLCHTILGMLNDANAAHGMIKGENKHMSKIPVPRPSEVFSQKL